MTCPSFKHRIKKLLALQNVKDRLGVSTAIAAAKPLIRLWMHHSIINILVLNNYPYQVETQTKITCIYM